MIEEPILKVAFIYIFEVIQVRLTLKCPYDKIPKNDVRIHVRQ